MNFKQIFPTILFVFFAAYPALAKQNASISAVTVFKNLTGCWQGHLHYSSTIIRKPYATTAALVIKQIGKSSFVFTNTYTDQPNDNTSDTIIISKNEKELNGQLVKSKRRNSNGDVEISLEVAGFDHDNNKTAVVRHTYILGKNSYTYKKDIQLHGQTEWMERQQYQYVRKPCG